MSGSMRRLKRLEAEMTPDTSWTVHMIWAHTREGFEAQKATMLADGRGKTADMFLWDLLPEGARPRALKSETYDKPWHELLGEMLEADRQREMA